MAAAAAAPAPAAAAAAATNECEWSVYVGRLVKCLRSRDVKSLFERFGRVLRCEIKYGTEMDNRRSSGASQAYAFIDYQVREDAEKCLRHANNWEINGKNIIVEWAKGRKEREDRSDSPSKNMCLRCRRMGHWARDCPLVGKLGRRSRSPFRSEKESADDEKVTEDATDREAQSGKPVIFPPPPTTLYKVMATHSYTGKHFYELNLEPGEVIYVIAFGCPEEQEKEWQGWQMGIKASDGTRGVFLEEFAQRVREKPGSSSSANTAARP